MKIIRANDLKVFNEKKNKNDLLKCENFLINYIRRQAIMLKIDCKDIKYIKIVSMEQAKDFGGKVEMQEKQKFNMILSEGIFAYVLQGNEHGENVVRHELYHIKDGLRVGEKIDIFELYNHRKLKNTKELILDIGWHQMSEFYAHYYTFEDDISQDRIDKALSLADIYLTAISQEVQKKEQVFLNQNIFKMIENFVDLNVIISARDCFRQGYFDKVYESYQKKYYNLCQYASDVKEYMQDKFKNYPSEVSEQFYFEIGLFLMKIFEKYNAKLGQKDFLDPMCVYRLI